jgi:hypothetical protein
MPGTGAAVARFEPGKMCASTCSRPLDPSARDRVTEQTPFARYLVESWFDAHGMMVDAAL